MPIHVTESTGATISATWSFSTGTLVVSPTATFKADVIAEATGASGVTVDGVLLKDGGITLAAASSVAVADGGTGAITAPAALTNLGAAASGRNADITSLNGLTTPLSTAQGGTSLSTVPANSMLYGAGTDALTTLAAGTSGAVLTAGTTGVPSWQANFEYVGVLCVAPASSVAVTSNAAMWHFPFDGFVYTAFAGVSTAATGTSLTTVDCHIEGTSIFTTRPTIDSGETKSSTATTPVVINTATSNFAQWAKGVVHVDVNSAVPAKGLVVTLVCVRTS